ncbi:unnamed protein product [Amoebophrya sp. A120]|nr:unnamed protein product [Amoebophrya sp. A120]|eukprot:GSA120T00015014001.1
MTSSRSRRRRPHGGTAALVRGTCALFVWRNHMHVSGLLQRDGVDQLRPGEDQEEFSDTAAAHETQQDSTRIGEDASFFAGNETDVERASFDGSEPTSAAEVRTLTFRADTVSTIVEEGDALAEVGPLPDHSFMQMTSKQTECDKGLQDKLLGLFKKKHWGKMSSAAKDAQTVTAVFHNGCSENEPQYDGQDLLKEIVREELENPSQEALSEVSPSSSDEAGTSSSDEARSLRKLTVHLRGGLLPLIQSVTLFSKAKHMTGSALHKAVEKITAAKNRAAKMAADLKDMTRRVWAKIRATLSMVLPQDDTASNTETAAAGTSSMVQKQKFTIRELGTAMMQKIVKLVSAGDLMQKFGERLANCFLGDLVKAFPVEVNLQELVKQFSGGLQTSLTDAAYEFFTNVVAPALWDNFSAWWKKLTGGEKAEESAAEEAQEQHFDKVLNGKGNKISAQRKKAAKVKGGRMARFTRQAKRLVSRNSKQNDEMPADVAAMIPPKRRSATGTKTTFAFGEFESSIASEAEKASKAVAVPEGTSDVAKAECEKAAKHFVKYAIDSLVKNLVGNVKDVFQKSIWAGVSAAIANFFEDLGNGAFEAVEQLTVEIPGQATFVRRLIVEPIEDNILDPLPDKLADVSVAYIRKSTEMQEKVAAVLAHLIPLIRNLLLKSKPLDENGVPVLASTLIKYADRGEKIADMLHSLSREFLNSLASNTHVAHIAEEHQHEGEAHEPEHKHKVKAHDTTNQHGGGSKSKAHRLKHDHEHKGEGKDLQSKPEEKEHLVETFKGALTIHLPGFCATVLDVFNDVISDKLFAIVKTITDGLKRIPFVGALFTLAQPLLHYFSGKVAVGLIGKAFDGAKNLAKAVLGEANHDAAAAAVVSNQDTVMPYVQDFVFGKISELLLKKVPWSVELLGKLMKLLLGQDKENQEEAAQQHSSFSVITESNLTRKDDSGQPSSFAMVTERRHAPSGEISTGVDRHAVSIAPLGDVTGATSATDTPGELNSVGDGQEERGLSLSSPTGLLELRADTAPEPGDQTNPTDKSLVRGGDVNPGAVSKVIRQINAVMGHLGDFFKDVAKRVKNVLWDQLEVVQNNFLGGSFITDIAHSMFQMARSTLIDATTTAFLNWYKDKHETALNPIAAAEVAKMVEDAADSRGPELLKDLIDEMRSKVLHVAKDILTGIATKLKKFMNKAKDFVMQIAGMCEMGFEAITERIKKFITGAETPTAKEEAEEKQQLEFMKGNMTQAQNRRSQGLLMKVGHGLARLAGGKKKDAHQHEHHAHKNEKKKHHVHEKHGEEHRAHPHDVHHFDKGNGPASTSFAQEDSEGQGWMELQQQRAEGRGIGGGDPAHAHLSMMIDALAESTTVEQTNAQISTHQKDDGEDPTIGTVAMDDEFSPPAHG